MPTSPPIHKACGQPLTEVELQCSDDTLFRWDEALGCYVMAPSSGQGKELVCQHCYTELDKDEVDAFNQLLLRRGLRPKP